MPHLITTMATGPSLWTALYTMCSLKKAFKKTLISTVTFLGLLLTSQAVIAKLDRRMSIEIVTNTVRFAIADVNGKTDKVYRYLDYGSLEAGFDDDLAASDNGFFSPFMFKKAQNLFQKLRTRQEHFRAVKISAIATETFRKAHNAEELVQQIRRTTGISIRILSPEEEDRMDFFSALTTTSDSDNPVVLNIGKESFQLIIVDPAGGPFAHKSDFGSINFMDYLKEVVQNKPAKTSLSLSPVSIDEINAGIAFARYLARKTPLHIRRKLKKNKSRVTAIGSAFQNFVAVDIAENSKALDSTEVEQFIREHEQPDNLSSIAVDKSSDTSLANAILVLGFMEELGIKKLYISDHNSTLGMLEYPVFWH